MVANTKKYKDVIVYLSEKLGGSIEGKKKLAKLLYFIDFDFFELHERSITGDTYSHLPMGPVPNTIDSVIKELSDEGILEVTKKETAPGYMPTEVFSLVNKEYESDLDKDEMAMIDRVVRIYGVHNGKQLEDLSHAEAPYIASKLGEEIDYELSFYRDTKFDF